VWFLLLLVVHRSDITNIGLIVFNIGIRLLDGYYYCTILQRNKFVVVVVVVG
jgi:hypothetical protein